MSNGEVIMVVDRLAGNSQFYIHTQKYMWYSCECAHFASAGCSVTHHLQMHYFLSSCMKEVTMGPLTKCDNAKRANKQTKNKQGKALDPIPPSFRARRNLS
jgi:hypothetical protein